MKKILPFIAIALIFAFALPSCGNDDNDIDRYADWRTKNDAWLAKMKERKNADGTPYYTAVVPAWNPGAYVLMHFFNDRKETEDNLVPLYTSMVDVIYRGYDCEEEPFDSSMTVNSYGRPGVMRFQVSGTIQGWAIALEQMHVGDSAEVIIPYNVAYGVTGYGSILPYSNLRFNMRLHDIYRYEASPY